jgi:hypothetical protein
MPGPMVTVASVGMCPHAGPITIASSDARVLASGAPVATMADQFVIAGCVFTIPPGKPQPCVRVQWLIPAVRVLINGQPPILQTSTGLALSVEGIPGGPPVISTTQPRAIAT